MTVRDISGRWHLVSWVQLFDSGKRVFPFGEHVQGFIQYDKERMFCLLEKKGRTSFVTGGQWDASEIEKASAYDSFMSYSGKYRFDGAVVVHEIEFSLFPNWENGTQTRRVRLEDDLLTLVARLEDGTAQARTAELVWKRA